ncbi:Histidine protein methyltransferase 1 [Madurella mycetomatis]|uniref:protein-histidine N-methyltransferase n=1 Tax=Madurella mycetomatis TaxID=100816 RepID=A0A175W3A7_9PEZI|nr:Histidine protein methyltransferase 1 [Madurella mycetomatis]
MAFSFSFAGDDIEEDGCPPTPVRETADKAAVQSPPAASAFPVQGKPQLPPTRHGLDAILSRLPSKIAFDLLTVDLGDGRNLQIPRRELWDVRLQLMAEDNVDNSAESEAGLGEHDVKTGIYEGGFKSWESSVDLVKVLASEKTADILSQDPCVLIELGCGTALPSLVLFQWALAERRSELKQPLVLTLADYNPTVLYLVTVPNLILAWALRQRGQLPFIDEAFTTDGELELAPQVLEAFKMSLASNRITLSFLSGAWSPEFVDLLYRSAVPANLAGNTKTLLLGSETIYSPFALESFSNTLLSILNRERCERPSGSARALVAAKRLYFGVGGSLDDFIDKMKALNAGVKTLFEETQGVHRGVVECLLP